jgi:hypothetical protein
MFYRGSFFVRFLLVLVLLGILTAAGYLIFQDGQAQGYALGQAASEKAPSVPALPYPGYYPYLTPYHGFFFPPFLGFLCIGGLLFVFFIAGGGLFRPHHWYRYAHGPNHEHWHEWEESRCPEGSTQARDRGSSQPDEHPEK